MKRLSKEGYRAGRAAVREGLSRTARQLFIQSFHRYPNFKSLFWWLITIAKLHPGLKKSGAEQDKKTALRVAFDIHPALVTRYSGFYAVGAGLLNGFEGLDNRPQFTLFYSSSFSEEATLISRSLGCWVRLRATVIKMRWLEFLWRWSGWPKLQNFTGEFDVYHSLHHLMPPTKGKPRILTVHDLRRYMLPQLYRKSKLGLFELAVKRADHFIAVSASTKKDLCDIFGIAGEKIDVVHLASGAEFEPVTEREKTKTEIKKRLSGELDTELEKYLLVFSSPDQRKNVSRTVEAFLLAQKRFSCDVRLIVVGKPPKNDGTFMDIVHEKAKSNVVVTGPLKEVADLFRCADGLVFASLYEGFGIPILEAFASGVPVITSNCSSMPEVGADAALYVDPYDIESIAEAMIKLCNDAETKERLVKAGFERQKNFSWTKTAAETLKVYEKVAAG
ncbi:MAG: glycosyltransferase [Planctomycetes bacterium]|nr:glycosyltransferase [Planctomycetota bacterium]